MYLLKNAVKNLMRNKGRNLIVAVILLAMLTFTAIAMIINAATDGVIKNYKEQFGSEIYLQYDTEKLDEERDSGGWADIPEISDDVKLALADSNYLKETMIHVLYPAYAKELKGLDQGKSEGGGNIQGGPVTSGGFEEPNLTVHGYNTPELMKEFKEGKRTITSGRMFENDSECIVSEDFARLNGLKAGDKIGIRDCSKEIDFSPLELTVTGVYFDATDNPYGYVSAATNPRNDILTTYETMRHYQSDVAKTKLYSVNTTYYLKNPDLLEAFNQEAHEKGLHKNYRMSTDEVSYNKIVKPAENVARVSGMFLTTVLVVGSVILILLSVLSIRERKYEIGVLRAMGMKKSRVVRGILYEALITVGICMAVGLSFGAVCAQPVSDAIKQNQQEQSVNSGWGAAATKPEQVQVSLTLKAAVDVSAIALLLAVVSSSAGVLFILRYEPMKILTERN